MGVVIEICVKYLGGPLESKGLTYAVYTMADLIRTWATVHSAALALVSAIPAETCGNRGLLLGYYCTVQQMHSTVVVCCPFTVDKKAKGSRFGHSRPYNPIMQHAAGPPRFYLEARF
jgi:hypothetical protein